MGRKPQTLLEVCVAAAGGGWRDIPRGSKVALFVCEWAVASDAIGGAISTEAYAEWWRISERQAWRRRAAFHELFPDDDPQDLADLVLAGMRSRGLSEPTPNLELAAA